MLKRVIILIIVIVLILQVFLVGILYAFAEDDFTNLSGSISVVPEDYSSIHYYNFNNPNKVTVGYNRVVVLESPESTNDTGEVVVFDMSGNCVFKQNFCNPQKAVIINKYCFILDIDFNSDSSFIYALDLENKTISTASTDSVYDIAESGNFLYALTGNFSKDVVRYLVDGSSIILDDTFIIKNVFANTTAITAYNNLVLGYKVSALNIGSIVTYDVTTGKSTELTSIPSGGVLDFKYDGKKLYIVNSRGCYIGDLSSSPDFVAASYVTTDVSSSQNLIYPTSISIYGATTSDVKVYIMDNGGKAVKTFTNNGNNLHPAYFTIGSFSNDEGAFNTPLDVAYDNGKAYYADSLNKRINVIFNSGRTQSFIVEDSRGNKYVPLSVGVDYSGNIYVATKNKIFKYSSTYRLIDEYTESNGKAFSDITAFYVSPITDDVYVIANSKCSKLNKETNTFENVKSSTAESDVLTIDSRYEEAIINRENELIVYETRNFTKDATITVGKQILDTEVDFNGSLYVLVSESDSSFIYKYVKNGNKYTSLGSVKLVGQGNEVFTKIALNPEKEIVYLLTKDEHRVYKIVDTNYAKLGISFHNTIAIPKNIFDKKEDKDVSIGTVLNEGNCLIYPLNEKDPLYPINYSITRTRKLNPGDKVIVCGLTSDEQFAYVLYNNNAGFMDISSLSTEFQYEEVPYEYGVALHENVQLYKYPLVSSYNLESLYSIAQLKKNTPITIINRASDYVCPSGLYWYYVSYVNDSGEKVFGYIPRYNTVENTDMYVLEVQYGQIDAEVLRGYVEVYADLGVTPLGKTLLDKTKIAIIDTTAGNYYYIQEVNENGDGIVGYVNANNITYEAQTRSTTIAYILIAALIVVILALFLLKIISKKYRRNNT